ncbi:serine kinase [Bacillus salipaludis]|uniref:Serine kinase n=1 Tax=Bacillus salipaludis TaxID=2547811 RepID=A0A4R5VIR5_9BACI|nr:serine kinase [Bacillus salipaludis]
MKLFFVILLILFGSFLIGLTDDVLGKIGNIIMHILGIGCVVGGIMIARSKKGKKQSS